MPDVQHSANIRAGAEKLKTSLAEYGIADKTMSLVWSFQNPVPRSPKNTYRDRCTKALADAIVNFEGKGKQNFILVVLPPKDTNFYPEVKRWGDCVLGVPTVCVTEPKLKLAAGDSKLCANIWYVANLDDSITIMLTKSSLKVNFKLCGLSHEVVPTSFMRTALAGSCGSYSNTMVVGADVTHPGKTAVSCPAMAAIVATNDNKSCLYLGSARLQKGVRGNDCLFP